MVVSLKKSYILVDGDHEALVRPDAVTCTGCPADEAYQTTSLAEARRLRRQAEKDLELPRQDILILRQTSEIVE